MLFTLELDQEGQSYTRTFKACLHYLTSPGWPHILRVPQPLKTAFTAARDQVTKRSPWELYQL